MGRLKLGLRIAGVVVAAVGLMCLPVGYGVSPKRDLSQFNNLADMGAFSKAALAPHPPRRGGFRAVLPAPRRRSK